MNRIKTLAPYCLAAALTPMLAAPAAAEQYWIDNSFSFLYGGNYKMVPAGRDSEARTLTIEHASGHSWGKLFMFIDRIQETDGDYRETYGEVSPTVYLKQFDTGLVKSINAAFMYEFGSSTTKAPNPDKFSQDNYLAGVSLSLNIPGMDFFDAGIYHAWNNNNYGRYEDDQLTLSYGWHHGNWIIDGFLDFTPSKGSGYSETELNFTPQISYDIAPHLNMKGKLKVGVEYAYWKNKFGADTTQNNVSLLVKWHL